jgi:dTDP-4-dehydrorhamnose reductase
MTRLPRILITGCNGQLGLSFQRLLSDYPDYELLFIGREQLDLTVFESIAEYIQANNIDIIINCAAYTAVDKAEVEYDLAYQVNYLAVEQLAKVAFQNKIKLIHISTDYVFNGESFKPYTETDLTKPINTYGDSKLKGEQALLKYLPTNGLIIRTSWVYSEFGQNFVKTIKKLASERDSLTIVADQVGCPTYATDLAQAIMQIIIHPHFKKEGFVTEVFQYSNEGVCSWYDFAMNITNEFDIECDISPIEAIDYPTAAKRPYYSVLNKMKIKTHFNLSIPYWKTSLTTCANSMKSAQD